MALLPTLIAVVAGSLLGVRWGGRLENVLKWRPPYWGLAAGALAVQVLLPVSGLTGTPALLLNVVSLALAVLWAVWNVRVGGMVLVAVGLGANLIVTLLNAGMPVSADALRSAGLVEESQVGGVTLTGGRHLADGDVLGFLGGTIPLPTGQVLSIGDVVFLVGLTLVVASLWCRRRVHHDPASLPGARDLRGGLAAMGRGPAPRKGPGLHPSRLSGSASGPGRGEANVRRFEERRPA